MSGGPAATEFYVTGGTMVPDAASYVVRAADDELFQTLRNGEYCYVLTTRQMGKSSLMARTAERLAAAGIRSAQVTLETVRESGTALSADEFLYSVASQIHRGLALTPSLRAWWQDRSLLRARLGFTGT